MSVISMKALLETGVHFGHRTRKWNPRMKPYIFTERNGIHIIDLQQTVDALAEAYGLVRDKVAEGGTILFVGTKRQAQETMEAEAVRCGMPYVNNRWLGGTLTNWRTIVSRITELESLEKARDAGEFEKLTKKEAMLRNRKIARLYERLGGLRTMKALPALLFVVDVRREETGIHEANLLRIPVLGLVDTNCDPSGVDYVIPSNDDAIRAIKLLVARAADAVLEGKAMRKDQEPEGAEDAKAMGTADSTYAHKTAKVVESDDEVEEGALLGESTLAKLSATRKPEDMAVPSPSVEGAAEAEPSQEAPVAANATTETGEQAPASPSTGEPETSNQEPGG